MEEGEERQGEEEGHFWLPMIVMMIKDKGQSDIREVVIILERTEGKQGINISELLACIRYWVKCFACLL